MNDEVLLSGNLATPLRTIAGVIGQFAFVGASDRQAAAILSDAGLPSSAMAQLDFPISLRQELQVIALLVDLLDATVSPITLIASLREAVGLESFGVLGMTMRHAATLLTALELSLEFPQLNWGHSRLLLTKRGSELQLRLELDLKDLPAGPGEQAQRLRQYCIMLDLVSMTQITQDLVGEASHPVQVTLPWPQPPDWRADSLGCPVIFDAPQAAAYYPASVLGAPLPRASDLLYRNYYLISERLSHMLADNICLSEQVTRWLWAQTPVLKRGEIARLLARSERTLTRQLRAEGTSYAQLLSKVQNQRAQAFLLNPQLSVTEVAERLGYSEPAAFSRAFTGWNDEAPLRWRQRQTSAP